ncbi:SdrD B-like domain-containing protein, partial [Paenibacillus xylaniclasticus]|uniref:SdrD B-like domain-containing protein n=1 Tax=Paenibacillus xylaniclasticus TaxID=588083 RepID=UPI002482C5A7
MKKLAVLLLALIVCAQAFAPGARSFAAPVNGIILVLSTNKDVVDSGEEFSYIIAYSASSNTSDYINPSISLTLPAGVTYTDTMGDPNTTSNVTDSIYPGQKEVTFQFKNGTVPAGATGQLVVKGKFENYVTPNSTAATTKAVFTATENGTPVTLESNEATVYSKGSAVWNINIEKAAPIVEPVKGSDVQYKIVVKPDTGNGLGLLDIQDIVVTAKLDNGAVFISADNGGTLGPDNTVVWGLNNGLREEKTLKVTVHYPNSMLENEVTTTAEMTSTPLGGTPATNSYDYKHGFGLSPLDLGTSLNLDTNEQEISPGQSIKLYLSSLSNKSNVELGDGLLEIMTPTLTESGTPVRLELQTIKSAIFSGIWDYDLYYTLVENPAAGDWMLWSRPSASAATAFDATAIGEIKGIQARFGNLPITWRQESDFEFTYKLDSATPVPANTREIIRSSADFIYSFVGNPKTSSDNSETSIVNNRPLLELQNSVSQASAAPSDIVTYTLSVTNDADLSSDKLNNPIIYTILPADLEYVPGSWSIVRPAGIVIDPIFTTESQPSGGTKLTWSWDDSNPGVLNIGETIRIMYTAEIKPGAAAQTVTNTFGVQSPNYLNDVNYTNPTPVGGLYAVEAASSLTVTSSTALQSKMWVKGELDADWLEMMGTTTPGGQALYRLEIQNTGNVPMRALTIVNPFPRIGDTAVLNGSVQRDSKWGPVLMGPVTVPSYVTVYYSTTPGITMNPATGSDNGAWTEILPADPTSVTAIKLQYDSNYVIHPLDKVTLEWAMRAPVGAPTGGKVAWNSFAYKVNDASGQALLPSEPLKVGMSIQSSNKASIGDYVWLDSDENGVINGTETGINGVTVELYDVSGSKLATTVTSNDFGGNPGSYLFPNLDPGQYQVTFALPSMQYRFTEQHAGADPTIDSDVNPATGKTAVFSLAPGEENLAIDAGMVLAINAEVPSIDTQPIDRTVNVGDNVNLTVGASGGVSLSYQWYFNTTNSATGGTEIAGATSASYVPPTTAAGTTYYYVIVTNTDNSK